MAYANAIEYWYIQKYTLIVIVSMSIVTACHDLELLTWADFLAKEKEEEA